MRFSTLLTKVGALTDPSAKCVHHWHANGSISKLINQLVKQHPSLLTERGKCFKMHVKCFKMHVKLLDKRDLLVMKQFILLEIMSTAVLLATVVVDLSRVFHAVDSAALQVTHRRTPAPYGMLAVPAALPTHSFGDVDPCLDSNLCTLCYV